MDKTVLQRLYREYYREIYIYLFSLCRNRDLAEDLVQETFLKALLGLPESCANMRAWLYVVARNLYFNHAKSAARVVPMDETEEPTGAWEEVSEQLIRQENMQVLYRALERLDRSKREILVLQYFCEMKQREIAALLKLTPENVRVLAYRAKRELKKYMEEDGYDIS